jgi:hypothetical protein
MDTLVKEYPFTLTDGRRAKVMEYADGSTRLHVGQIDHTGHAHPATPAARRACRKELRALREKE